MFTAKRSVQKYFIFYVLFRTVLRTAKCSGAANVEKFTSISHRTNNHHGFVHNIQNAKRPKLAQLLLFIYSSYHFPCVPRGTFRSVVFIHSTQDLKLIILYPIKLSFINVLVYACENFKTPLLCISLYLVKIFVVNFSGILQFPKYTLAVRRYLITTK